MGRPWPCMNFTPSSAPKLADFPKSPASMSSSRCRFPIAVLVLGAVSCGLLPLPALANSQARIVRLSDVEGTVQIDRDAGQGYERAFLNMPIVQGTKLWTKDDGRAEVEFEDGTV